MLYASILFWDTTLLDMISTRGNRFHFHRSLQAVEEDSTGKGPTKSKIAIPRLVAYLCYRAMLKLMPNSRGLDSPTV